MPASFAADRGGGAPVFRTPSDRPAWLRWLWYSPPARLLLFCALLALLMLLVHRLAGALGLIVSDAPAWRRALGIMCLQVLPALGAYLLLVRFVERRVPRELAARGALRRLAAGAAGGAALVTVVVGILGLSGSYHVLGVRAHPAWLPALLVTGVGAGVGEEIAMRGALFRILEEGLGSRWALGLSAALFGAAHFANPGASVWSMAAIAIEAGLLLGLVYHLTRSLWPCIGLHAAWNLTQGLLFGIPVSGIPSHGWLRSLRTGPAWFSGGHFGAEASLPALLVCLLVTAWLLHVARRRGSLLAPAWRR